MHRYTARSLFNVNAAQPTYAIIMCLVPVLRIILHPSDKESFPDPLPSYHTVYGSVIILFGGATP